MKNKKVVGASDPKLTKAVDSLITIHQKEPDFSDVLNDLTTYLGSTYSDKYGQDVGIDTSVERYSKTDGRGANMHDVKKYLRRYMATGFEKSGNPKDIQKAIHYLLYELTRLHKLSKTK